MTEISASACEVKEAGVMDWFNESSPIAVKSITEVVNAIKAEYIRLPLYQRDSVWEEGRVCALWDSLLRGFPLPSFFLAEGQGNGRCLSSDGVTRCLIKQDQDVRYFDLVDGQQRLTAICKGFMEDTSLRLWIDLAPPKEVHPFQFKYWIHPCTSTFPFGFRMRSAGEHRFENFSDAEIRDNFDNIWPALQELASTKEGKIIKEVFEIALTDSFPWAANCPIPLDQLLLISESGSIDSIKAGIEKFATKPNVNAIKPVGFAKPDDDVVNQVANALIKLRNYKLVLQKTMLGEDSFTLYERIGRGGIQISPRQLAVSELMLEMGKDAKNAVAEFQKGGWKDILDTVEIIHAVFRISHAIKAPPGQIYDEEGRKALLEWDMFELDLTKIKEIKRDKDKTKWESLIENMRTNCVNLKEAFDAVFSDILHRKTSNNKDSFSLVQLAQTSREGGIHPITLHPLLYWAFYVRKDGQDIDKALLQSMLQWIIFSNGIVSDPAHKKLNQLAFHQIALTKKLDFLVIRGKVFSPYFEKEREEIGLAWNNPVLNGSKEIVEKSMKPEDIPHPKDIVERTMRRLVLRNWADKSGVNDFILMWNQREMLDEIYGETKAKYIHALYGKGRPVDADHIVARNLLSGFKITIKDEMIQLAMADFLSDPYKSIKVGLKEKTFRLDLPNLKGNLRYWPKYLNRAEQDSKVNDKFPRDKILARLDKKHPLYKYFNNKDEKIGWKWSTVQHESDWDNLPPDDNVWTESKIVQFIKAVMTREYDLYAEAYKFLMPDKDIHPKIVVDEIIKD